MTISRSIRLFPLAVLVGLAACGPSGRQPVQSVATQAPRQTTLDAAMDALNQGDEAAARKQIKMLLKADPTDSLALVLQDSLDRDPVDLLGPKNYPYVVQLGDTMMSIAEKFLGNKIKFYQLARYNDVKVPSALTPGNTLKIPGIPPQTEAAPPPVKSRPAPASRPRNAAPKAVSPVEKPAARKADPAASRQLRSAGLAALNQGRVTSAVLLLRRAAAADPDNPLVARDLARAERIAKTVQEHH